MVTDWLHARAVQQFLEPCGYQLGYIDHNIVSVAE